MLKLLAIIVGLGAGGQTNAPYRTTHDLDVIHTVHGHSADLFVRSWYDGTPGARIAYGYAPLVPWFLIAPGVVVRGAETHPGIGATILLPKQSLIYSNHIVGHDLLGTEILLGHRRVGLKLALDYHWLQSGVNFYGVSAGLYWRQR